MMQALYYDRDGRPVSRQHWQQLGRQPGYSCVGYADATRHGQQVTVITFWSGIAGDGPDGPLIFCTCAGIRAPGGRHPAYQRLWGWPDLAAARAGHQAITDPVQRDQGPLPQLYRFGIVALLEFSPRWQKKSPWSVRTWKPAALAARPNTAGWPPNPPSVTAAERVWQMTCALHVAWDERLTDYHFGPGHPLAPVRLELTMHLAHEFGLWSQPGVTLATPDPATDADLELVHEARYIAAVRTVSGWAEDLGAHGLEAPQFRYAQTFGLGTGDQPVFPGMHHASALVTGATLAAARAAWSGPDWHGASIAGGMHHAMAARASGFGVYNDVAVAIAWLLRHGAERIAYLDIDAHHGDGVQAAFWADPRVLTISVHQHPADMFPFTGLPAETGGRGAEGTAVNVALPARTGDAGWLRAFHAIVPLLARFRPQILVSQHGCDTHWLDPLARLELSIDGQHATHAAIHTLAHDLAGGRWLLTGGGGYELVQVVPRSWTHLLAEAAGQPIDPGTRTPARWRDYVARRTGLTAPEHMTEGAPALLVPFESGYDPGDPVDRAIMATRSAVFPLHGLMPM